MDLSKWAWQKIVSKFTPPIFVIVSDGKGKKASGWFTWSKSTGRYGRVFHHPVFPNDNLGIKKEDMGTTPADLGYTIETVEKKQEKESQEEPKPKEEDIKIHEFEVIDPETKKKITIYAA